MLMRKINQERVERGWAEGVAIVNSTVREGLPKKETLEQNPQGVRGHAMQLLGGEHSGQREEQVQTVCLRKINDTSVTRLE